MRNVLIFFAGLAGFTTYAMSDTQDEPPTELDELAIEVFDRIQPLSIRDNLEYCGSLGIDRDGYLAATPAARGERDSCQAEDIPEGFEILASYHTHGGYAEDADTEVPSIDDLKGDFDEGIDGYIATPGGRVWLVLVEDRVAYTLCGPGCVTADPNYRECAALPPGDEHTLETLRRREQTDTGEC